MNYCDFFRQGTGKAKPYAMAQAGQIPAFKIHGQWRIKRTELDQWIDAQPRGGDGGGHGE